MAIKRPIKQYQMYGTGKKVYTNGSHAPTRGTVNPKGYVKREMAKKPSNRRSGLAKAALKKLRNHASQYSGFRHPHLNLPSPGKGAGTPFQNTGRHPAGVIPKGPAPTTRPTSPSTTNPGTQPGSAPAPAPVPQPQTVKVNPNGQLDLPYDEDLAWQILQGKQNSNAALLDLQQQQQVQAQQFANAQRDAGIQFTNLQRQTLNNDAARGMAFSSGHGFNVAENARNHNNFMGDLNQQNAMFNQGIDLNRMQIQNSLSEMLRQAGLAQAQRMQDRAGELGFGASAPVRPTVPKPSVVQVKKPTPKPAAKKTASKKKGKK